MERKPISRWFTVAAGGAACATGSNHFGSAFGVFIVAISTSFDWTRGTVTYGLTFKHIASGIGALTLGALITRFGVRRPTIVFATMFAVALTSLAFIPQWLPLYYAMFLFIGFFGIGTTALPYAVSIAALFNSRRGLALGLMMAGSGVGAVCLVPYAHMVSNHFGWRGGLIGLALLVVVVQLPGLLFLVRGPGPAAAPAPRAVRRPHSSGSYRELFAQKTFWLLGAPIFAISVAVAGVLGSLIPLLTDRGFSKDMAVAMVSMAGAVSWVGRIVVGYLLDRVFAPYLTATVFAIGALGFLLINLGQSDVFLYLGVACLGVVLGAEADLITYMSSRYFNPETYGRTVGGLYTLWAWGNASGFLVMGLTYDLTQSYDGAGWGFAIATVLAIPPVLMLGPYKFPADSVPARTDEAREATA